MSYEPKIRTPDQRLRVFVSSTLGELADERKAARDAIVGLRLTPILFELGARPHPPRDLYRSYLRQSDVFIGIYWERYGWVAPGEDVSGLEDEYLLSGDMPKLIYFKRPAEPEPRLAELLDRIRDDDRVSYKSFADPDELKELIADDLAVMLTERFEISSAASTEPASERAVAMDLPIQPTRFVGRERETAEVVTLLGRPDVRLLTLTGPGGIGKSRLAFEVAAEVANGYRDGVNYVLLSPITNPNETIPTIGKALGVKESAGRSMLENLKEWLRDKQMLLLLDNFEHVVNAAPSLSELLTDCPDLTILVTSRAVLLLRGEHEYPVPPLGVPDLTRPQGFDVTKTSAAVRLFADRARSVDPSFELTPDNAPVIAQLCNTLDGLPLAIELAAARSRLLTPEAMLERLDHRLKLLTGGPRDLPARQRTMRAAIDWDYDLLTEEEQMVFRCLSVFAGGFILPDAERVVNDADEDFVDVLGSIDSLVGKSLLRSVPAFMGEPRFTMLKILREYALEKLDEHGEAVPARRRHAMAFVELAEAAYPRLRESDQVMWLTILEREHDNFRAALRWAEAEHEGEVELRIAGALARFWEYRGYLSEGQHRLEEALARNPAAEAEVRARALDGAGCLARAQGEFKRAWNTLEECVSIYRTLNDRAALAQAIHDLGNVAMTKGDLITARVLFSESLALRQEVGDRRALADTVNNLGVLAEFAHDYPLALEYYGEALEAYRERGDLQGESRVVRNIGEVHLEEARYEEAREYLREALVMSHELRARWDISDLLEVMAAIVTEIGNPRDAARLYGAGQALREFLAAPLGHMEQRVYDERLARLKTRLEPATLDAAWAEGRAMEEEEAVKFALNV